MPRTIDFIYADHEVKAKKISNMIESLGGVVFSISTGTPTTFCVWYSVVPDEDPEYVVKKVHDRVVNGDY